MVPPMLTASVDSILLRILEMKVLHNDAFIDNKHQYFWLFLAPYWFSISHLVSCYSSGCICSLNKCSSSISANLTSSSEGDLHSTSQKSQMLKKKEECYCYSCYNLGIGNFALGLAIVWWSLKQSIEVNSVCPNADVQWTLHFRFLQLL